MLREKFSQPLQSSFDTWFLSDKSNSSFSIFQILDGFVIILSASGQVLYVSDSIKDSLEHSPHNIVGEYIHSLVHPDDHEEINRNLVKETSPVPESSFNTSSRKRK